MIARASIPGLCGALLVIFAASTCNVWAEVDDADAPVQSADAAEAQLRPQLFSGRVVYLQDALARRDLETAEETAKHVVLETDSGELIPILADWRGRAFYQDEHLRDRKVELIGVRHAGVPYLNVIAVYTFDDDGQRMFTDYWCDICSIPMYEIQPCECCQGPIQLRFQPQELPDYIEKPVKTLREGDAPSEPTETIDAPLESAGQAPRPPNP